MLVEKKPRECPPGSFFQEINHETSKPQNRRIRRMTGNITSNDLAYYCPPASPTTLDPARPADRRPIYEPTVYFIAESVSESLRWINIAG